MEIREYHPHEIRKDNKCQVLTGNLQRINGELKPMFCLNAAACNFIDSLKKEVIPMCKVHASRRAYEWLLSCAEANPLKIEIVKTEAFRRGSRL